MYVKISDVVDQTVAFDMAGMHHEFVTGIATYAQYPFLNVINGSFVVLDMVEYVRQYCHRWQFQ